MKSLILSVIICVFAFAKAYSQQLEGIATYQTQRHVAIKLDSTSGISNEMQKTFQEQLRKQFQKEYTLTFNQDEKTWKENESLSKPSAPASGAMIVMTSGGGNQVLYQNIKEQTFKKTNDLMGKLFLVEDSLEKPEWKLEKETKNIGQYQCFKATLTREVPEHSFLSEDDNEEEVTMKTIVTTAWYTLDIPVQQGPDTFWGLPGLILEVNDGKMSMMCTKVILNPTDGVAIEQPTKGKKVNAAEFKKISNEKNKEMMERYQTKGKKGGTHMTIEIKG